MKARNDQAVQNADELREYYRFDYNKAKPNRFADRFDEKALGVVLDPDVAAVFKTSEAANQALRGLLTALGSMVGTPDLLKKAKNRTSGVTSSQD